MMTKCDFCEKYYPGKDGCMKCQADNYELKYDNACKAALDRMMHIITVERLKTEPVITDFSNKPGDILDRLFRRDN